MQGNEHQSARKTLVKPLEEVRVKLRVKTVPGMTRYGTGQMRLQKGPAEALLLRIAM